MDDGLMLRFNSPDGSCFLDFEDCGKVAYAYLKRVGEIVGDVWLYNRCEAPVEPEWTNRSLIPFALSRDYLAEGGRMTVRVHAKDVKVDWEQEAAGPVAYVYVFDNLYGVLGVGDKPGYARFATKSSRLAQVMEVDTSGQGH